MSSAPLALTATNLSLGYQGRPVCTGIDLDVSPGEIVTVLGTSGCGKSTLLRAFAGLLAPLGGELRAGGQAISGPSADRTLVFQDDALLPWRTAQRNVELPLSLQGVPRRERRLRALLWLQRVGLDDHVDRLPRQLSGGMRQRVQLARALSAEPGVILMDEPFGALDAHSRRGMQRLLVEAWQQAPTTVVFVTHDAEEAVRLGDRVVVIGPSGVVAEHQVARPRAFDEEVDLTVLRDLHTALGPALEAVA